MAVIEWIGSVTSGTMLSGNFKAFDATPSVQPLQINKYTSRHNLIGSVKKKKR